MLDNEKYVSMHIEKTGGTALKHFFMDLYGPEKVLFYYPSQGGLYKGNNLNNSSTSRERLHFIRNILVSSEAGKQLYKVLKKLQPNKLCNLDEIPEDTSIIHGHFNADRWDDIPNARLTTVVREPFNRTVSHYRFIRDVLNLQHQAPDWFSESMTFPEFAMTEQMIDFQTKRLSSKTIGDFEHIGTTQNLRQYCDYFDPLRKIPLKRLNKSPKTTVEIPEGYQTEFQKVYNDDYSLFEEISGLIRV